MARMDLTAMSAQERQAFQEAAQWYAQLLDDASSEEARGRWRKWLSDSDANQRAWRMASYVGGRFDALHDDASRAVLSRRHAAGRRRAIKSLALLAGAGVVSSLGVQRLPWRAWTAQQQTARGEIRSFVAEDGSRIWLDSASAVDIDYDATLRRVQLRAGRMAIQTAPDPLHRRPLVVQTAHGLLRPLGTRFTVQDSGHHTLVAVFEGEVQAESGIPDHTVRIAAGSQLRFGDGARPAPTPAARYLDSWRRGDFVADETPLSVVVDELARYRRGHLGCADAVARLRLYGVFPLVGDAALTAISRALPVDVQRRTSWWVDLVARAEVTK